MLRGKSILVVDDEEELRELITGELHLQGCIVYQAANGKEAIEMLLKHRVDGVLCDVRMPVMDGLAFLDALRESEIASPVVLMLTAHGNVNEGELKERGATALLQKPFRLKHMISMLDASMSHSRRVMKTA
jgi:two-component system response regulator AtoC